MESPGQLVGEGFVVSEAVLAGGADRRLVEAFSLQFLSVEASDLGGDQRDTVSEVVGAVIGPDLDLPVVRSERLRAARMLLGRYRIMRRACQRQRRVKMIFGHLDGVRQPRRERDRTEGR
jgi:hypothetical protein